MTIFSKKISMKRCFEHLFMYLRFPNEKKKQYLLSVISLFSFKSKF